MANNFDGMFADLLPKGAPQAPQSGAAPAAASQGKFDHLFADLVPVSPQVAATAQSTAQLGEPTTTGPQVSNISGKGDSGQNGTTAGPQYFNSEVLTDMNKAVGAGLEKGVTGLIGAPREFSNLAQAGIEKGASLLGYTPEQSKNAGDTFAKFNPSSYLPGSDTLNKGIEAVQGTPIYEAKSTPGQYADSVAQMVPAAITGPGGALRKLAMTVIPGVAAQAAGDIPGVKGTAAEPFVRAAATLATGLPAASIGSKTNAITDLIKNAPAQSEVKAAKDTLYKALQDSNVNYDTNSFQQMATDLSSKLNNFRAAQAPLGADAVKAVVENVGKPMNFTDFDSLRQTVGNILREPSATNQDKAVASIIMDHLNNFEKTAPLSTNGLIPAGQVSAVATQARELARRNIIANQLNEMDRKAPGYVGGTDSAIKNQAGSYLKSQKEKGLSDMEKPAFEKMVRREGLQNAISTGGSRMALAASHGVAPIVGSALGSVFGPVGTAVGAGIGSLVSIGTHLGLRKLANSGAEKSLDNARKIVLAGRGAQDATTAKVAANSTSRNLRVLASGAQGVEQAKNAPAFRLPNGSMFQNPTWDQYQRQAP